MFLDVVIDLDWIKWIVVTFQREAKYNGEVISGIIEVIVFYGDPKHFLELFQTLMQWIRDLRDLVGICDDLTKLLFLRLNLLAGMSFTVLSLVALTRETSVSYSVSGVLSKFEIAPAVWLPSWSPLLPSKSFEAHFLRQKFTPRLGTY